MAVSQPATCEIPIGQFLTPPAGSAGPDPGGQIVSEGQILLTTQMSTRHRGSTLISQAEGKVAQAGLPLPQWTYELDGLSIS